MYRSEAEKHLWYNMVEHCQKRGQCDLVPARLLGPNTIWRRLRARIFNLTTLTIILVTALVTFFAITLRSACSHLP